MLSRRRPGGVWAGAVALLSSAAVVQAKTVVYDFNVTWLTADPTGRSERPVIGINGQWPLPTIECSVGDALVVNVHNQLGNQSTSIHFHGMFQNGTSHMDGAVGVTQCPIPPGSSMKYNFTANQPGTYWYHSHVRGQYSDGLRGAFVVHDPDSPYKDDYDAELVLTVSDWYNEQMTPLIARFLHVTNPTGAEPVPDAALLNDTQNLKVAVEPGKTYLFRIINVGALASQYVWFEGHTMKVVEVDGVYTDAADADMIYLTPAQRYGVLVTAKDSADANFAFVGSMDQDMFDQVPPGLDPNVTGWLAYDEQKEFPTAALIDEFAPFDDFALVPVDKEEIHEHVDFSVTLDMKMDNLGDGINYAFFNDITYLRPKVPTLYSALTTGSSAADPAIYGVNTHPYVLKKGDVVEIILNNDDPGKHPFHLHGHDFQTVVRSEEEVGAFDAANISAPMPRTPMRRDTLLVRPNGHFAIRFRADNPGVWLFHCHVEWHMVSGLAMTLIEAPEDMPLTHNIPDDHLRLCERQGIATAGNAVGNQDDLFDLTGANVSPPPLPAGFTPRGIVALTFSILSALIGVVVVSWYGMAEIKTAGGAGTLGSKASS